MVHKTHESDQKLAGGSSQPARIIYFTALAVLLAFLPLVVLLLMRSIVDRDRETRFAVEAAHLRGLVLQRADGFIGNLLAAQGLFAASKSVERNEWQTFAERLKPNDKRS